MNTIANRGPLLAHIEGKALVVNLTCARDVLRYESMILSRGRKQLSTGDLLNLADELSDSAIEMALLSVAKKYLTPGEAPIAVLYGFDKYSDEQLQSLGIVRQSQGVIRSLVAIMLILVSNITTLRADIEVVDDVSWAYSISPTYGAVVCGCSQNTGSLAIPERLGGVSVGAIGVSAFAGKSNLEGVKIPEGVLGIDDLAFSGCTRLATVTIPTTLKWYGDKVFKSCISLEIDSSLFPEGLSKMGDLVFENCECAEKQLILPSSLSNLYTTTFCKGVSDDGYFYRCTSLLLYGEVIIR